MWPISGGSYLQYVNSGTKEQKGFNSLFVKTQFPMSFLPTTKAEQILAKKISRLFEDCCLLPIFIINK